MSSRWSLQAKRLCQLSPRAGCSLPDGAKACTGDKHSCRHSLCHRAPHSASVGSAGCRAPWQAMPRANRYLGSPVSPGGAHQQQCAPAQAQLRACPRSELLELHQPYFTHSPGLCITSNVPYPRKKYVIYGTFKINARLVFLLIPNDPLHGELCSALQGQRHC